MPVRSCFYNFSAPAHGSGTYELPLLLPLKPEPPDLIFLAQRQPPQPPDPPDPPDPPLVAAASSPTLVTAALMPSASGINGLAPSLRLSAIPSSDVRQLRSASSPSFFTAATKLLRSAGADVSPEFFSVWAWPMNQVKASSPSSKRPHVSILAIESPSLKLESKRPFRCTADMTVPQALRVCLCTDLSLASLSPASILTVPRCLCVIYVHSLWCLIVHPHFLLFVLHRLDLPSSTSSPMEQVIIGRETVSPLQRYGPPTSSLSTIDLFLLDGRYSSTVKFTPPSSLTTEAHRSITEYGFPDRGLCLGNVLVWIYEDLSPKPIQHSWPITFLIVSYKRFSQCLATEISSLFTDSCLVLVDRVHIAQRVHLAQTMLHQDRPREAQRSHLNSSFISSMTDTAWNKEKLTVRLGWVFSGLEAITIRSALCMALILEFSTLKVLSDNLTLIRAISSQKKSSDF